jgi:hypothetical protein
MGAEGRELPAKSPDKPHASPAGGAESGAPADGGAFADAIAAIMGLPLTDAEKAAAVRRLLRNE